MATTTDMQRQQIKQILQTEVECVNDLLQALEIEYSTLAEHNAEALEDVVRSKQIKIQQLEEVTRQREALLSSFDNATANDNSNNNKHYRFNDDNQLAKLWDKLVVLAETCRDKNRVNGSIVETASRQSQHALDILRGIVPNTSSTSEVYDNAGKTKSYTNKHTLVHV